MKNWNVKILFLNHYKKTRKMIMLRTFWYSYDEDEDEDFHDFIVFSLLKITWNHRYTTSITLNTQENINYKIFYFIRWRLWIWKGRRLPLMRFLLHNLNRKLNSTQLKIYSRTHNIIVLLRREPRWDSVYLNQSQPTPRKQVGALFYAKINSTWNSLFFF